ncbi:phasin family protein [Hoeflea sp. AS60]|uniref:phasin family protein n=1 Tax=Hoeflea sp. AS60 TaxID=3135780 RepID=UPI00317A36DC
MTKTNTSATSKATETKAQDAGTIITEAVENLRENIANPEAAREFVAEQAANAQAHAEQVHQSASAMNAEAEKATVSLMGSYASFTRTLIDMTTANVSHAFATVEKAAAARSLPDVMQIQADYVRDSAKANYDRIREAADAARETVTQANASVQQTAAKAWSTSNKAA